MTKALLEGVGLLKLAKTFGTVEEFYVVAFRDRVISHRFASYPDAVTYYERLLRLGVENPGAHAKTLLALPEANPVLVRRTHLGRIAAPVSPG